MPKNARDEITYGRRRKLALVIGIGDYEDGQKLEDPENDANDMSSALETIGFIVTKKLNLKRVAMKHAIIDFEESIESGDIILFFFAGHGAQWEDVNYIIPADNDCIHSPDLNRRAINLQDILNNFSDRRPFVTIFLMDCSRIYYLRNPAVDARSPISNDPKSVGLRAINPNVGSLIAFACAPGCIAIVAGRQQHGLFTKHLLSHIKTPNEDIRMVLSEVTKGVMEESRSKQVPYVVSSLAHKHVCLFEQS
ncbi:unnamed protein product [Rotaria sp. Silwood2]|nr:unnamed protein product [Rotaria sp. Silwood2]